MAPPKKPADIFDEIAKATEEAAKAEAKAEQHEPPETVEIGGVTYYRTAPGPQRRKASKPNHVMFTVNLAPHARHIRVDNVIYHHGGVYEIREDQEATFAEICQRTWDHERSTGGANIASGAGMRAVARRG